MNNDNKIENDQPLEPSIPPEQQQPQEPPESVEPPAPPEATESSEQPEQLEQQETHEPLKLAEPIEPIEPPTPPEPPKVLNHVLPPKKYRLKILLMFTEFFIVLLYIYYFMIRSLIEDISQETFSWISSRMFSFYCVLAITIALGVVVLIFKITKSAVTRFERENEVRQNPNIKVWLAGFNWGWPILFLPTVLLMALAGLLGLFLNLFGSESECVSVIQNVLGGTVIVVGALNTAVVIFKLKPVTLGLLLGSFIILLLILLLHGPQTFIGFFKSFRHLGVNIEPLGYIILAYVWSVFLRIIWVKSLFYYWVFIPNRLELQHGLSESNDSVDRDDLRHQIDTDDVILRWFNVGVITFYFPELDRLPITNVILGIRKKAIFANRIASVKTMQD
jgi:hypothetical protein